MRGTTRPTANSTNYAATPAYTDQQSEGVHPSVLGLVILLIAYAVWAALTMHQRVRQSVAPANMAINVYNLALVTFTVILGLVIVKLALTKLALWRIPGAQTLLDVVDAA